MKGYSFLYTRFKAHEMEDGKKGVDFLFILQRRKFLSRYSFQNKTTVRNEQKKSKQNKALNFNSHMKTVKQR
jgi:hypothetical protein